MEREEQGERRGTREPCSRQVTEPALAGRQQAEPGSVVGVESWRGDAGGARDWAASAIMELRIEYLADHPQYVSLLAEWHHKQFDAFNPRASVEQRVNKLKSRSRKGGIPTTVVALLGDTLVGSASLIEHDMESRQDLSPWIASVYVHPDYRRRGIGTRLVQHLEQEAKRLGAERLYLFTPDMRPFYETIGWSVLEDCEYRGRPTTIMEKRLAG